MKKKADAQIQRLSRNALGDIFLTLEEMLAAAYKDGYSDGKLDGYDEGYDEAKETFDEEMKS